MSRELQFDGEGGVDAAGGADDIGIAVADGFIFLVKEIIDAQAKLEQRNAAGQIVQALRRGPVRAQ